MQEQEREEQEKDLEERHSPSLAAWGDLPWPLLGHVLAELSTLLAAQPPLYVAEAAVVAAACSPNRHWAESAATELQLAVRCSGGRVEVQQLFQLAQRCRITALHFDQRADDDAAAAAVAELLAHPTFDRAAGPHLRLLHGAPSSSAGRRNLQHFSVAAFPRLEQLHIYVPPHQQVLSLRNPAWAAALRLRRLEVCGRHYVALRELPPHLLELQVSAWHVLVEPCVLVRCPQVRMLAAAVLLSEHVLPYPAPAGSAVVAQQQLAQLAELLAAAGLPPGHTIHLATNLVCFQRHSDGVDAKLTAPTEHGWQMLYAAAGGVMAMLEQPEEPSTWPGSLGPNAPPGTSPEMRITLEMP